MITNIEILNEKLVDTENFTNVIDEISWNITIEKDGKTTSHVGVSKLAEPLPSGTFIEYANLTKEQKLKWAFDKLGGEQALLARLLEAHDAIVAAETVSAPALPVQNIVTSTGTVVQKYTRKL